MPFIKVYTREPIESIYPPSLAGSVHFAYSEDGKEYTPCNCNYGVLFAKGSIRENDTIEAKSLANPKVIQKEDEYCIFAEEMTEDGTEKTGNILMIRTKDFVFFEEQNYVSKEVYESELNEVTIKGDAHVIEVPEKIGKKMLNRWMPVYAINAVKQIGAEGRVKALVTYSDGSTDLKKVDETTGEVLVDPILFPMAIGLADPVIFYWEGDWYFLATNDNNGNIGLFARKADTVKNLFAEDVQTVCILDYDEEKEFIQTFWAPEFHIIGDELYILFAVGGKKWAPQSHMMKLKKGGDILKAEDWETPIRVKKMDGSNLTDDGITLDMTYFKVCDISYVMWSYRFHIGTPLDTGSMLYIATIDEKKPWMLTSDPVLLSRPLYGWENVGGTINNEGPYPLLLGEKVYIAYSGGSANGYSYAVGYLIANAGDNLLDPASWKKEPSPVLCSTYIDGIEGPGHNSFFYDEDGKLMVAYHAQEFEQYKTRCSTMHRVHIGVDGFPFLNMSTERDIHAYV